MKFQAHMNILSARSPAFEGMFSNKMVEHETGIVNVAGISKEVFNAILEYMYTGTCPNLSIWAAAILPAADRYLLTDLKDICEEELIKQGLTYRNIFDRLKLADLHSLTNLRSKCLHFFVLELEELLKFKEFRELTATHPNINIEIYREMNAMMENTVIL